MNRIVFTFAAVVLASAAFGGCAGDDKTSAGTQTVTKVDGNIGECAYFGLKGMKVENPTTGAYGSGDFVVTMTVSGNSFNWSSTIALDKVAVKGGPNTMVYAYDEAASGTGLTTEGGQYGLSHVLFCYDDSVDAGPDATPLPDTTPPPDTTPVTDTGAPPDAMTPPCDPEEDPEC